MHDKSMTKPAPRGRTKGKPVAVVKQGSAKVPIYEGKCHGRVRYTVSFYLNERRHRRTFGKLDAAKEEARLVALNIQRGLGLSNDLCPQERESFLAATRLLDPLGLPLVGAVEEFVECRRLLDGVPLLTAVQDYLTRARGFEAGVTVPRAVEEMLEAKKQDGLSGPYLYIVGLNLRRFAADFPGEIRKVTSAQIDAWLRKENRSAVTRNDRLKRIKNLFNFAKRRGFLPRNEETAAESLKPVRERGSDVGILTPEEMQRLLDAATDDLLPFLTIGGFAGLRMAEICRLDWKAVNLERRLIELRAEQAKTATRRLVPISENLAAWLDRLDRRGPVVPYEGILTRGRKLAKALGIDWPHNALRHSYISYRIAEVQNAAQVALEAGNSPAIIFKHYRELVTREEAQQWFGIFPESGTAVTLPGRIDTAHAA